MAEDESELEKRAVEELLRETDRARLRAETMGPAGWLKCPLRGTNKRFLLNTLRSTGLRPGEPKAEHSSHAARRESPAGRSRSRSPPAGRDGGRSRKRHRGNTSSNDVKRRDGERERSRGRKGERDETAEKDRRTSKASAN